MLVSLYTIWKHIQKFGLAQSYRNTPELAIFVRQIMAIPFLPADLIHSTYSCLQIPILQQIEKSKLEDFIKYFKKYWLTKFNQMNYQFLIWKTVPIMEQKATMQD